MENVENYIAIQYKLIGDLIKEQIQWGEEMENEDVFNEIMDREKRISEIHAMILDAKERCIKQRMYLQLMVNPQLQLEDGRKTKGDYLFITINPPDQLPHSQLISATEQFCSLKVVKGYTYVFEQRGQVIDDYHGFHTHILIERNDKPSATEKELMRIFTPLVPNRPSINVRWLSSKDDVSKCLKYMSGQKDDPNKAPAVLNNTHMRTAYNLLAVYSGKSPLLVRDLPRGSCLIPEVD